MPPSLELEGIPSTQLGCQRWPRGGHEIPGKWHLWHPGAPPGPATPPQPPRKLHLTFCFHSSLTTFLGGGVQLYFHFLSAFFTVDPPNPAPESACVGDIETGTPLPQGGHIMTPPKHPLRDGFHPQTLPGDTEVSPARPSPGSRVLGGCVGSTGCLRHGWGWPWDPHPGGYPEPKGLGPTGEPGQEEEGWVSLTDVLVTQRWEGVRGALGAQAEGSLPQRGAEGLGGGRVWC